AGTRLWPRSRASTPKHVLPFADRGRPLLRATYDRARLVADEVFVLTEARQRQIIEAVLPEVDESHLILEPYARGTTNAYGLASLILNERTPGAVMIALPADHVVHGKAEVSKAVRAAVQAAATTGCLVTVALRPTFPSTGLGYIHAPGRASHGTLRVRRFIHKPDAASANRLYQRLPVEVVDRTVMEKTDRLLLVPAAFDWADIGNWAELGDHAHADARGNSVDGEAILIDTTNSLVFGDRRLVAAIGLQD